jgi:acyl carrier protein
MKTFEQVRSLVTARLQLGERGLTLAPDSPLLGALPELDSQAVIYLIISLEEQFGFVVADDEMSADTFATLGSLAAFVEMKLGIAD